RRVPVWSVPPVRRDELRTEAPGLRGPRRERNRRASCRPSRDGWPTDSPRRRPLSQLGLSAGRLCRLLGFRGSGGALWASTSSIVLARAAAHTSLDTLPFLS